MKKTGKILVGIVLFIGIVAGGIRLYLGQQIKEIYKRLDAVAIVDVSNVKDGTYRGIEETPLVKVTVDVSVKDHRIADIRLVRHENGKGAPAEAMLPKMIEGNTSETDAVSGATMSAKAIRAAVRKALAQGARD
ncbi:MAG: FMN-binding protein [Clostridia bacterium]|nr:FMN-binding protein [Clostridia bacterium]